MFHSQQLCTQNKKTKQSRLSLHYNTLIRYFIGLFPSDPTWPAKCSPDTQPPVDWVHSWGLGSCLRQWKAIMWHDKSFPRINWPSQSFALRSAPRLTNSCTTFTKPVRAAMCNGLGFDHTMATTRTRPDALTFFHQHWMPELDHLHTFQEWKVHSLLCTKSTNKPNNHVTIVYV